MSSTEPANSAQSPSPDKEPAQAPFVPHSEILHSEEEFDEAMHTLREHQEDEKHGGAVKQNEGGDGESEKSDEAALEMAAVDNVPESIPDQDDIPPIVDDVVKRIEAMIEILKNKRELITDTIPDEYKEARGPKLDALQKYYEDGLLCLANRKVVWDVIKRGKADGQELRVDRMLEAEKKMTRPFSFPMELLPPLRM